MNVAWFDKEQDHKWMELKHDIKCRDMECLAYSCLTPKEKMHVESINAFWNQKKHLQGAHIISRIEAPHIIYDPSNVILLCEFLHRRLDRYKDLVTGEYIGKQGKYDWITRIMQHHKKWGLDYTYQDFWNEKMMGLNTNI